MTDAVATQARNLPLPTNPETTIAGRTFIVTGANTGLGFEAAKHLALLGASRVILAVRNLSAGLAAKQAIEDAILAAAGGDRKVVVDAWELDLSRYESVREFVARAERELERIDGVVENAAVAASAVPGEKAEGHVLPLTVNVLATLLMAVLLVPVMRAKRAAGGGEVQKLVVVTSRAGFDVRAEWEGIQGDILGGIDASGLLKTYSLSKLAETFAVRHLARELMPVDKTGIVIDLVCPGLCVTSLARNAPPAFVQRLSEMHAQSGRTAEDGSRTLLHAVVAGAESHGKLLHSCHDGEADVPDWVKDDLEMQKQTWDTIAKELEAIEPGCVGKMLKVAA